MTARFLDCDTVSRGRGEGEGVSGEIFATLRIIRRVGVYKAFELLMMGRKLNGKEAAEICLVNKAVPEEEFELEINRYATRFASLSPVAVRMGKAAFCNCIDMEYLKAIKYMGNMMAINASSDDCAEGVAAFFEKREPHWRGY